MVQTMVPNQNVPLVLSQEAIVGLQLGYVLPRDLGSYHILVQLFQVCGELGWDIGQSYEILSYL